MALKVNTSGLQNDVLPKMIKAKNTLKQAKSLCAALQLPSDFNQSSKKQSALKYIEQAISNTQGTYGTVESKIQAVNSAESKNAGLINGIGMSLGNLQADYYKDKKVVKNKAMSLGDLSKEYYDSVNINSLGNLRQDYYAKQKDKTMTLGDLKQEYYDSKKINSIGDLREEYYTNQKNIKEMEDKKETQSKINSLKLSAETLEKFKEAQYLRHHGERDESVITMDMTEEERKKYKEYVWITEKVSLRAKEELKILPVGDLRREYYADKDIVEYFVYREMNENVSADDLINEYGEIIEKQILMGIPWSKKKEILSIGDLKEEYYKDQDLRKYYIDKAINSKGAISVIDALAEYDEIIAKKKELLSDKKEKSLFDYIDEAIKEGKTIDDAFDAYDAAKKKIQVNKVGGTSGNKEVIVKLSNGSYVVKTDEVNGLPIIGREKLEEGLKKWLSGQMLTNALSVLDDVLRIEQEYKISSIFTYALMLQECSMGTANTSWVRENNWTSLIALRTQTICNTRRKHRKICKSNCK